MNNDVVVLNLDRPRNFKFTNTSMKMLEEITGRSINEIDAELDLMDHDVREKMVYCGLLKDARDHNEAITPEKVVELLEEAPSFAHILECIVRAWRIAFGADADATSVGNHPAASPPTKKQTKSTGTKASE